MDLRNEEKEEWGEDFELVGDGFEGDEPRKGVKKSRLKDYKSEKYPGA